MRSGMAGAWTLMLLAAAAIPGARASDLEKLKAYGQHLSGECTTCHRIDGSDNGIPSIVGWPPEDFAATLGFYKDGARSNPAMVSVAQSLDDEQIQALAAFFGALPKPEAVPAAKAEAPAQASMTGKKSRK